MRKKQFLALLTALVMILGVVPSVGFAAEGDTSGDGSYSVGDKLTFGGTDYIVATDNLITNGDFENGFEGWSRGDGAQITDDDFALENTGGSDGGKFVTSKKHTGAAGDGSIYRMVEVEPNTAYYHSYQIKGNNIPDATAATDYVMSYLVSDATAGKEVEKNATVSGRIGGDKQNLPITYKNTWTMIDTVLVGNGNAKYFTFNARWLGEKGVTTSFDDLTLYKLYPAETAAKVRVKIVDDTGKDIEPVREMYVGVDGQEYVLSEAYAPAVRIIDGKYYTRGEISPVTLSKSEIKDITVTYSPAVVETVNVPDLALTSVIAGDKPILPKKLEGVLSDGVNKIDVEVKGWTTNGDITKPGKVTYTAEIDGYNGDPVTLDITVLPCDNEVDPFYIAGNSDGASFTWNNKLGYVYAGGTAVFELDFVVSAGTNKLFSYGNSSTADFNGTGPIIRYANNGFFEYHNGDWVTSAVPYKEGKTYRLTTIANVTAKTYHMYITDEDGVIWDVTGGDAKFRNQNLSDITMMFHHGAGYTAGEAGDDSDIISHRTYWQDGWTKLNVNYNCGGETLDTSYETKAATGKTYVDDAAERLIVKGGKIYVLDDMSKAPSLENVGEQNNVLNVNYNEVTATVPESVDPVETVQTQYPNMVGTVKVTFDDGQSMDAEVVWDKIDVNSTGNQTVTGTVTIGSGEDTVKLTTKCNVHIIPITIEPYNPDKLSVATNNGGWNWYVEPSGTHIAPSSKGDQLAARFEGKTLDANGQPIEYKSNNGYVFKHDKTYMGWVEDGGDIVVAEYDHDTGIYKRVVIHEKLESDDHNNPAVVVLPDGRILAVYSMHTNEAYMYFRISKRPEDISEWNEEQYYHGTNANATYPSVFMVHDDEGQKGNDVIYIGWRGVHWKPTFAKFPMPDPDGLFPEKSDGDGIQPVMEQTQFANTTYGYSTYDGSDAPNAKIDGGATDAGRRPYTKYDYDCERNKIYVTFTANHPDNDRRNHIYYLYLNIADNNLYTAKNRFIQPLPKENKEEYVDQGACGTSGQWGVVTVDVIDEFPELLVFNATEQTENAPFQPNLGAANERRGWTWDIIHNEKGEPCIVYADITATPPGPNGELPTVYRAPKSVESPYEKDDSRTHHYYWYARWDSESQQWVKTFLTYGGKWFHQNDTQERCYSGGLTFDHNYPGNVIYMAVPVEGEYGLVHEIVRWESDDFGATWTKRQAITENSPTPNARPNAIYNYRMDGGTNAGPRLLWISGEYRYWMNYEYKTGVKTDFAGMLTQDDPEMFADGDITLNGEPLEKLPAGETATLNAKFVVSNISIGDGHAKFALAHYGANGSLKGIKTVEENIPARSVPQTGVVGGDKDADRPNGLSAMGEKEIEVPIDYEGTFENGDFVKLFAWDWGIEQKMTPIMTTPYEVSTSGSRYLIREDFTYDGDDKYVLDGVDFNGWTAKGYDSNGEVKMADNSYVAVTKAPFGNTGLHIYRVGGQGLMVSHSIPNTNGKPYALEFTMRHIDEMSWNNTQNQGFTLSHGIPAKVGDTSNPSAFQYRFRSAWRDENGRGTSGALRRTAAFDGGSEEEIFHNVDMDRGIKDNPDRYELLKYDKGDGYYDNEKQVYIHDYNDALYTGSLFRVKVLVDPTAQNVSMSVFDGYRTASYSAPFNSTDVNWQSNPIDTITFSVGADKWGEIYIDDFRMYLTGEEPEIRTVTMAPADESLELPFGSGIWDLFEADSDGASVFFDDESAQAIDVGGHNKDVGAELGLYSYNRGDNQKFYLEQAEGGYLLKGKESNLYVSIAKGEDGSFTATLQNKDKATVFVIEDVAVSPSAAVLEIIDMILDGTYESTYDAVFKSETVTDELDEKLESEMEFIEEV